MSDSADPQTIRTQISNQFSSAEIIMLAYDQFPQAYDRFALDDPPSRRVRQLVSEAQRQQRLGDLLTDQPTQSPAPTQETAPPTPRRDFTAERLRDIEAHIESHMDLLRQYENELMLEDDPRRNLRIKQNIDREKEALHQYQQEAANLKPTPGPTAGPTVGTVQASLDTMSRKIDDLSRQVANAEDRLASGQQAVQDQLRQQQRAILAHIDQRHEMMIASLIEQMEAQQLEVIDLLLDAADQQQIAQWEASQLTLLVQQALTDLHHLRQGQPDAEHWQRLLTILEDDVGWQQKLKLTLPLIPGILEFESEAQVEVMGVLNEAWQRLLKKIGR
jgi:hypothetical protein